MTQPLFSVIVPSRARPKPLAACLEALARQDLFADRFEVIVVDDGSDPPLEPLVGGAARGELQVRWLRQANAGPASARNAGAAAARGELLAFTDDDCMPSPGWLTALAARLDGNSQTAVGGRTVNSLTDNAYAAAGQLLVDYLYATLNSDPERAQFLASNNLAVPTERFRSLGGFDTRFTRAAGEDRELCARWLRRGHSLLYAPEAVVSHSHELTLASFVRQQVEYGRGAALFRAICRESGQRRVGLQPLSYYFDLLSYPLHRQGARRGARLAALLAIAQAAVATGSFLERVG